MSRLEDKPASARVQDLIALWRGIGKDGIWTIACVALAAYAVSNLRESQDTLVTALRAQTSAVIEFMAQQQKVNKEHGDALQRIEGALKEHTPQSK